MKKPTRAFLFSALLALTCIGLLGGCQLSDTEGQKQASAIGYGDEPKDYEAKVRAFMETYLKDPDSAKYKFGVPFKAYTTKSRIEGGGVDVAGWVVPVDVNSKNSYGGYVGFEGYKFIFKDGVLVKFSKDGEIRIWQDVAH